MCFVASGHPLARFSAEEGCLDEQCEGALRAAARLRRRRNVLRLADHDRRLVDPRGLEAVTGVAEERDQDREDCEDARVREDGVARAAGGRAAAGGLKQHAVPVRRR